VAGDPRPGAHHQRLGGGVLLPGCGSERLFSQVGSPPRRCSGTRASRRCCRRATVAAAYPQRGSGQFDQAEKIITDNRVLSTAWPTRSITSTSAPCGECGTCHDQLQDYRFDEIFPGSRILDIHEFLLEKGVRIEGVTGVRYMYHDSLPFADEDARAARRRQFAHERGRQRPNRPQRSLLRRVGHLRGVAPGHRQRRLRFRKQQEMERGAARLRDRGLPRE